MPDANCTPSGWRLGDAGHTIFGPKTDRPSPETIATCKKPENARLILRAVESHTVLVAALESMIDEYDTANKLCDSSAKIETAFRNAVEHARQTFASLDHEAINASLRLA